MMYGRTALFTIPSSSLSVSLRTQAQVCTTSSVGQTCGVHTFLLALHHMHTALDLPLPNYTGRFRGIVSWLSHTKSRKPALLPIFLACQTSIHADANDHMRCMSKHLQYYPV